MKAGPTPAGRVVKHWDRLADHPRLQRMGQLWTLFTSFNRSGVLLPLMPLFAYHHILPKKHVTKTGGCSQVEELAITLDGVQEAGSEKRKSVQEEFFSN